MNCSACVKINSLPQCIHATYAGYYLTGLVFDATVAELIAKVKNTSNGKVIGYFPFVTDFEGEANIDIYSIFPAMNHVYEISFFEQANGNPAGFTITNEDGTTSQGCCIEFGINKGWTDSNDSIQASSQGCQYENLL